MFKVSFSTENEQFANGELRSGVASILRDIASRIENSNRESGYVYDVNGNKIGEWELEVDESEEEE